MDLDLPGLINTSSPNLANQNIGALVFLIINDYALPAGGIAMLFYLLFGGYQIMTAAGNPKQVSAGQAKIQNAIVGFVIMFAAYWIIQLAIRILGLTSIVEFR